MFLAARLGFVAPLVEALLGDARILRGKLIGHAQPDPLFKPGLRFIV